MKGDVAPNRCWCQKTRVFLLPHSEDRVILSSFIWIGYQRVTDGQTDRRTDGRTELPWLIQLSALQAMRQRCKKGRGRQFVDMVKSYKLTDCIRDLIKKI